MERNIPVSPAMVLLSAAGEVPVDEASRARLCGHILLQAAAAVTPPHRAFLYAQYASVKRVNNGKTKEETFVLAVIRMEKGGQAFRE